MAETLENLLIEERTFAPSAEFAAQANARGGIHTGAEEDWLEFWRTQATERIDWFTEPTRVLNDDNPPFFKWFEDGELNLSYNCVDRHLAEHGDQVAYHWIGEPGDTLTISYRDLHTRVCRFANALVNLGVRKGDRVAIYMGMIPELPVAMLACARIGAVHSVVFGGFSSDSLADRILDADARVVITQDGSLERRRRGAAQGQHRRGPGTLSRRGLGGGREEDRDPGEYGRGERPLVARRDGRPTRRIRTGAPRGGTSPLHPLHIGHHRTSQGDRSHPGGVSHLGDDHPLLRLRPEAGRRHLLVRGGHRLGYGTFLHRSTGRSPTARPASCTRGRPTIPASTGCGRSLRSTG